MSVVDVDMNRDDSRPRTWQKIIIPNNSKLCLAPLSRGCATVNFHVKGSSYVVNINNFHHFKFHTVNSVGVATLQKLKYDIHTKLPLESYQIQFWYDSSGNLV